MSLPKWGKAYWVDLAERTGRVLVYSGITLLTANTLTNITWMLAWTIVGLPTVLSALTSLLANLDGAEPSTSFVNVTSAPGPLPKPPKDASPAG